VVQSVLSCNSVGISLLEIALSAWMSASSFAGSLRSCAFTLNRNFAALDVVLFQSSSITSRKVSTSGAFTNVVFPPSPTHLFSSAWLSQKLSIDFVTGVLCNAKTKAASSRRFELNSSSSRPTFLCCLFVFPRRFT